MQNKRGSIVLLVGIVILFLILLVFIVNKYFGVDLPYGMVDYSQSQQLNAQQELTKTDEISDIEKDLNSTNTDNLDADVLGITSQVE